MQKYNTLAETKETALKWSKIANAALSKLPKNEFTRLLGLMSSAICQRS